MHDVPIVNVLNSIAGNTDMFAVRHLSQGIALLGTSFTRTSLEKEVDILLICTEGV